MPGVEAAGGDSSAAAGAAGLPLSQAQRAFWFREMLSEDEGASSTLAFGANFDSELEMTRLDRALRAVVARHPLLRARFSRGHDGVAMTIERPPSTILTSLGRDVAALNRWCTRSVSLETWPPCRAAAAAHKGETRLRVSVNHAVFDGQSKDVFLRELSEAYSRPRDAPRSAPAVRDAKFWRIFVDREAKAHSGAATSTPNYSNLVGTRRTEQPNAACESLAFEVEPGLLAQLAETASRWHVSKFTLYLAAWHSALARFQLDDADVVTLIALSTRDHANANDIGPFVTQAPVRSTSPRLRTFRELVLEIARRVRWLAANRVQPHLSSFGLLGPAPEVSVSYRRDTLGRYQWVDANAFPLRLPPLHAPRTDVEIRMLHVASTVFGVIDVDLAKLPRGYAARLGDSWRRHLVTGTSTPDVRVDELSVLDPPQQPD